MHKQKYLMKKITPKEGVLRNVHVGILGRECELHYLGIGSTAVFNYKLNDKPRQVITSYVLDIKPKGNTLVIETINTVYELEKVSNT